MPAGAVTDRAGNESLGSSTVQLTVDTTALLPIIELSEPNPTPNQSFGIAIDFGEPVTGFGLDDLTLLGASASDLRDLGGGRFEATIEASRDGELALLVPAGAAVDAAGNPSLRSAAWTVTVDTVSPAPALRSLVAEPNEPNRF